MVLVSLGSVLMSMSFFVIWVFSPYWLMGVLILQALFTGLFLSSLKLMWFSYILFLVILGGLLVIFSYISSLISEEVMDSIQPSILLGGLLLGMVLSASVFWAGLSESPITNQLLSESDSIKVVESLFSYSSGSMYVFIVFYLLLALVCVVSITKSKDGPLRLRL